MSTRNPLITRDSVTQEIIDAVRAEVGAVDLNADSTLQSNGLDSLKVMSLLFKLEERYGVFLDAEDGDELRTVGDLAALVVRCVEDQQ